MAVTITVVSKTYSDVVVKVAGTAGSATLNLTTDILAVNEAVNGATQKVNIANMFWSGNADCTIAIDRNSVRSYTFQSNTIGSINLTEAGFANDSINNTYPLVFTVTGAGNMELWVRLKKVSGYKNTDQLSTIQSI